jgi:hypothetical protein
VVAVSLPRYLSVYLAAYHTDLLKIVVPQTGIEPVLPFQETGF